jgi:shikimate kinase
MSAAVPPNLLLVGFMGTGKSTLGRLLARRWRRPFVDTDEAVEKLAGKSIADIFAQDGEPAFRALERQVVESHLPAAGAVIACGGGLVVPEGMGALVATKGVVVTLFASPESILRRTGNRGHRPLLEGPDPEAKVKELLAAREKAYLACGIAVFTDGRTLQQLADAVERIYRRESPGFRTPGG